MDTIKFYQLANLLDLAYDGDETDLRLHGKEILNWGAETEEEYNQVTESIDAISYEGNGWHVYAWYDVSGYDYWMIQQEEPNYINITVSFDSDEVDRDEIPNIQKAIDSAYEEAYAISEMHYYPRYKRGGSIKYNTGRSWHLDRQKHNKSEDWEKPMRKRKQRYATGGGVGLKERSERDSIKLAKAYQKVLDSNFADKEYDNYQKMVKETQIPKEELQKLENYISNTPKGKQRMIDIYRYWGTKYAKGGGIGDYKITLKSWDALVYEDDYNEGEGEQVNSFSERVNKSFSNTEDFFKYINDNVLYYNMNKEYFSIMDDGRIVTSLLVDEDNSAASKSEIGEWEKGNKKLYSANYNFYVTLTKEKTPTANELSELLGIGVYKQGGSIKGHYNSGRSWHLDRQKHNKSEDWEKPMSKRKKRYAIGGGVDLQDKIIDGDLVKFKDDAENIFNEKGYYWKWYLNEKLKNKEVFKVTGIRNDGDSIIKFLGDTGIYDEDRTRIGSIPLSIHAPLDSLQKVSNNKMAEGGGVDYLSKNDFKINFDHPYYNYEKEYRLASQFNYNDVKIKSAKGLIDEDGIDVEINFSNGMIMDIRQVGDGEIGELSNATLRSGVRDSYPYKTATLDFHYQLNKAESFIGAVKLVFEYLYNDVKIKFAGGGGVGTDVYDFDKKMALINLDMIHEYSVKLDNMVTEETELEEWVKMKLTKVEQNVADVKHSLSGWEKFNDGGMIFKKQLLHISKYAKDLIDMIQSGSKLMSWQENKLAVSADYIDGIYHHMDYIRKRDTEKLDEYLGKYSKGGGINSGRDNLFKSQEPHEQKYNRKREWKEYKKEGWFGDWFKNGGGVGEINPQLNKKIFARAEEIYASIKGKNKKDFDDSFDKAIIEYGYDPSKYHSVMRDVGAMYDDDIEDYANGGNVGRDLLFKSQEPHEQKYKRKREWKEYKKEGWFGDWFRDGGGVGLKVSDLKKGDRLKKKGSAFEVDVLEVGNDWRSGHDYALIETPFGNPQSYIDVSNFVFSDGSPKPQYSNGGGVGNNEWVVKLENPQTEAIREINVVAETRDEAISKALKTNNFKGYNIHSAETKYAKGGGVDNFDYGSDLTDEAMVKDNLINGEISCETLTKIIGCKPSYPYQIVGAIKLEKCYLRPYYKLA